MKKNQPPRKELLDDLISSGFPSQVLQLAVDHQKWRPTLRSGVTNKVASDIRRISGSHAFEAEMPNLSTILFF